MNTESEQTSWEEETLGFSTAVQDEWRKVGPSVRARLSQQEYVEWVREGARLGEGAFRAWQVAVEYFRASAALLETLPLHRLRPWAAEGALLAQASADLAAAYFRASPETLPLLTESQTVTWGEACARLYDGEWQSGALAIKLFDASPGLLRTVAVAELGHLVALLAALGQRSYAVARQCLDLAQELLPHFDVERQQGILSLASCLAPRSPDHTREWLAQAYPLLLRVAPSEQARFLQIAEEMAQAVDDVSGVLEYLRAGAASLARLTGPLQGRVLAQAQEVLRFSPTAAGELVKSAPTLLERLDLEELEQWVREGRDSLQLQEATGIAYFKLEATDAHGAIRRLSGGVELAHVAEVLGLYCKALTGRNVQVLPTEHLTRRGIGWTSEGQPTTEGTAIFLPALLQVYGSQRENFGYLKVCATHQAAHLEFGSFTFQFDKDGLLFPRERGALEALQGRRPASLTDIERFFDLFEERRLAMDVFSVLEDARIDGLICREYPGVRGTLRRVQQETCQQRPSLDALPLRSALLEALLQRSLDVGRSLHLPRDYHHHFTAAWSYVAQLQEQTSTVEDAAEATLSVYTLLRSVPDLSSETMADFSWDAVGMPAELQPDAASADLVSLRATAGQSVGSRFSHEDEPAEATPYVPLSEVRYRGDFKPQLVQTLMKLKGMNQADPTAPVATASPQELSSLLDKVGEMEVSELLVDETDVTSGMFATNLLREAGQQAVQGTAGARPRETGSPVGYELHATAPKEYLYGEWDFRANSYLHNWCLVREKELDQGMPGFYDETLQRHAKLARAVQRQFQLMKPERFKKIKQLPEGEEYDLDAVIQAMVDRRAGQASSEKLYWRRNKEERSVAMAFLLDLSASTDEDVVKERQPVEAWQDWDDDPRHYLVSLRERMQQQGLPKKLRRRIIDVEKEATVLLVQALETLGDAYGVFGFSGYGRENVEIYVVKDLHEAFGDAVKGRLAKMEPVRGTRMGAAIRHALSKLDSWDARVKVLLLLSDGRPQDHNYGRDRTEREYALQDTRRALLEAKQKQIIPFALTVDREGQDYLKTICDGIGYEVVDDIESLPGRLPALYRQLTF